MSRGEFRGFRSAEKRAVVNNEYLPIDRMPKSLGQSGPVYYVPEKRTSSGQIPLAFNDWNGDKRGY